MSSLGTNSKDVPQPRLCHVVKWDGFDGYGFNLHAEKVKSGQYIGKVDEGSPSEAAGLKQGDRIVEVNEINISNETHKQVVERIKAFPNETKLLVVDQEADNYYKANNIVIKGTLPNIKVIKTPEKNLSIDSSSSTSEPNTPNPNTVENIEGEQNNSTNTYARSVGSNSSIDENAHKSISSSDSVSTAPAVVTDNSGVEQSHENGNRMENDNTSDNGTTGNGNGVTMSGAEQKSLNLKMSAKELRAQLAARKKFDPKKESMDFKLKFDIVQKL